MEIRSWIFVIINKVVDYCFRFYLLGVTVTQFRKAGIEVSNQHSLVCYLKIFINMFSGGLYSVYSLKRLLLPLVENKYNDNWVR